MSLIITNNKNLKNIAVISINNKNENLKVENRGDFTLMISNEEIVGINIFNYQKYFEVKEGAHILNQEQKNVLSRENIICNFQHFFTIGEIIERNSHPKSEKLFVLKIKAEKELQIVTNSLNSLPGKKVVVARVGAILPSGTPILHSKVMGIESEGMLCGGETLGLEKTEGVLIVEGNIGEEFIF